MLFNSYAFFVFFPVVTACYFVLPHTWRWFLLLTASCIFYMYFVPKYILILGFTIVVDYIAGIMIDGAVGKKRRTYLWLSIVANVGVLAVFKYFNFLNDNVRALATFIGWNYPVEGLALVLPIGLSFHTFQAMSYTIEVYRGRHKAERHFGIYALYVMFYPQLVAGPIERPQNLLHQFRERHQFDYDRVTSGLKLMAWGLFKKTVVADQLAPVVNAVYADPAAFSGPALALATTCFAFQVFCDFSGYSDIARGSARVMGFTLMRNFDGPYLSTSIAEFWRKWHISLSTWLGDYVFRPLTNFLSRRIDGDSIAGIQADAAIYTIAVSVTFLLSGLWHGANWTFVAWGAVHGTYLIASVATRKVRKNLRGALKVSTYPTAATVTRVMFTFVLTTLAWVLFRAPSMDAARSVYAGLLSGWGGGSAWPTDSLRAAGLAFPWIAFAGVGLIESVHFMQRRTNVEAKVNALPWGWRWTLYYGGTVALFFFSAKATNQFIYFAF